MAVYHWSPARRWYRHRLTFTALGLDTNYEVMSQPPTGKRTWAKCFVERAAETQKERLTLARCFKLSALRELTALRRGMNFLDRFMDFEDRNLIVEQVYQDNIQNQQQRSRLD